MKNIQLVLIIAIIVLVYMISLQWSSKDDTPPLAALSTLQVVETTLPPVTEAPTTLPPVTEETKTTVAVTPDEIVPETTEEKTDPNLIEYRNTNFGYHLSLPKKMYYAGFGARNGATHTLAIQEDALPETFADATVRVSYYGKKILPELQNTERYIDPNGKYILLLIDGAYSVRIEADNLQGSTVKAIEGTIGVD